MPRRHRIGIQQQTTGAADARFEHELEVFRGEAETATQFFYAFLTVHAAAGDAPAVQRLLNSAPLFWKTNLGALQLSTFVTLGRIFDARSKHNIDRLLNIAQNNAGMFSKAALAARKQGTSQTAPNWLGVYLLDAYVPSPTDFRRLRAQVKKHRRVYEQNYRDLRHKIFAHKELTEGAAIEALFAKTNIRELALLLAFLRSLHSALLQLFDNGRKPALRPRRYSVASMRKKPSPKGHIESVEERITRETEAFLRAAS